MLYVSSVSGTITNVSNRGHDPEKFTSAVFLFQAMYTPHMKHMDENSALQSIRYRGSHVCSSHAYLAAINPWCLRNGDYKIIAILGYCTVKYL